MKDASLPEGIRKTMDAMQKNSIAVQWDDYGDGPTVAFILKDNNDCANFFFMQPKEAREIAISLLLVAEKVDGALAANKKENPDEDSMLQSIVDQMPKDLDLIPQDSRLEEYILAVKGADKDAA